LKQVSWFECFKSNSVNWKSQLKSLKWFLNRSLKTILLYRYLEPISRIDFWNRFREANLESKFFKRMSRIEFLESKFLEAKFLKSKFLELNVSDRIKCSESNFLKLLAPNVVVNFSPRSSAQTTTLKFFKGIARIDYCNWNRIRSSGINFFPRMEFLKSNFSIREILESKFCNRISWIECHGSNFWIEFLEVTLIELIFQIKTLSNFFLKPILIVEVPSKSVIEFTQAWKSVLG
jgi:hypothetical protein